MLKSLYKNVRLSGQLEVRRNRNRNYLMELTNENLLLPYYLEAGLRAITYLPENLHNGWDSPLSQIRGTVLGHWLSSASQIFAETGDVELKARIDYIVSELAKCQKENGGEWCFSIPEKYLYWIKRGKHVWAPHYVCHKTMMGLLDAYRFAGNEQALEIVKNAAKFFLRFTDDITPEQMKRMMWEETGGIMELFADLYAITKDPDHLVLVKRYERKEMYELLEAGEDPLTNMHANATVPEIHGAARAYEVTGDERYRWLVERYWDLAVRKRGTFATGSQTSGEIYTPIGREASRLSKTNQEHCFVYNMMRLANYLFSWTGQKEYADYWERNLYNGLMAQGYWEESGFEQIGVYTAHRKKGYVAYHLPLHAGARKVWGSATGDFWCCHCTLMQANAFYPQSLYYQNGNEIIVAQYQDSSVNFDVNGVKVFLKQYYDPETGEIVRIDKVNREVLSHPSYKKMNIEVNCEKSTVFSLAFRCPWWLSDKMKIIINGQPVDFSENERGFAVIEREWNRDKVEIILPKGISIWPLADRKDTVAFLDGPVVLAGLVDEERTIYYTNKPEEVLERYDERIWSIWQENWKTVNQPVNFIFKPLYEIGYETYTTYFPIKKIT
ncbi:MAG TPA: hypothetical protein GX505_04975 [Clostridiales bacterium]|nr:hypothetical protein [Clostridiales bacterium]